MVHVVPHVQYIGTFAQPPTCNNHLHGQNMQQVLAGLLYVYRVKYVAFLLKHHMLEIIVQ